MSRLDSKVAISNGSFADPTNTEGQRRIMDINASGGFLGTKHAMPEMIQVGGGYILNISPS